MNTVRDLKNYIRSLEEDWKELGVEGEFNNLPIVVYDRGHQKEYPVTSAFLVDVGKKNGRIMLMGLEW